MRRLLVGIDPGVKTTGVAIYDPKTNELSLFSSDLQKAMIWLAQRVKGHEAIAIVEDPRKNSLVYGAWNEFTKNGKTEKGFGSAMTQAQRVGMAKAATEIIIMMIERAGFSILTVAPSARQRADKQAGYDVRMLKMPTKTDASQFAKLTGFSGVSSEHARDAATLVWGYSVSWAEAQILIKAKGE